MIRVSLENNKPCRYYYFKILTSPVWNNTTRNFQNTFEDTLPFYLQFFKFGFLKKQVEFLFKFSFLNKNTF